jgi:N-acetylglucosamine kinase-like BadF-type ATPase
MVVDESAQPVFLAQGGSANFATNNEATLRRSLERALQDVPEVEVACACFAGLVSQERATEARRLVQSIVVARDIQILPDYAAALRACPEGTTLCVVAGTGSVVCSRVNGGVVKSGGGGYLLGDEGSGFQYGRAAVAQFVRHPSDASVALRSAIEQVFESTEPATIIERLYGAHSPASLLAGLATALLRDAQSQVPYALLVIRNQSRGLAEVALEHMSTYHTGLENPMIGLAGGLWKRASFRDAFAEAIHAVLPTAVIVKSEMPPVRGAALLAMESV